MLQYLRYHNFNPRAPCGARPKTLVNGTVYEVFQPTRPLRGATRMAGRSRWTLEISTHAPLAGRDYGEDLIRKLATIFQPTRPLRGATRRLRCARRGQSYFNPRAPCGARRAGNSARSRWRMISTHAPLAGRDHWSKRSSVRGGISTHAPLAGRDCRPCGTVSGHSDFNPRAPCGARQIQHSCLPAVLEISTHAPLAGRDCMVLVH